MHPGQACWHVRALLYLPRSAFWGDAFPDVLWGVIVMMLLCVMPFDAGSNPSARDQGLPRTAAHVAEGSG